MTKETDWTRRTHQIRAGLSTVRSSFMDRRQVEKLFSLNPYQARRFIGRIGPMLHGNTLVVDREDILKLLSDVERDWEIHHLRVQLADTRVELEQALQNSQ